MKWTSVAEPLKKLVYSNGGSTGGRNSSGRITSFHRGGGAKRVQRKIDFKRNTPAMGVVERIEYDPNRSSRLALVRWIEGVKPKYPREPQEAFIAPQNPINPISATVAGQFPLACLASGIRSANPFHKNGTKLSNVKDVFVSAFASTKATNVSLSILPRIAVSGARPAVFIPRGVEESVQGETMFSLSDVQRWNKDSVIWDHRLRKKAAMPWSSVAKEKPVGLTQAAYNRDTKAAGKSSNKKAEMADRAALSYILASDDMEPGKIVMNCALPKRSTSD